MTVLIDLSPETEQKLRELAARSGKDVPAYIQDLVEKQVREATNGGAAEPHAGMSFAQILAPLHEEVAQSGMTEEQLAELAQESIEEVRAEKRRKAQP